MPVLLTSSDESCYINFTVKNYKVNQTRGCIIQIEGEDVFEKHVFPFPCLSDFTDLDSSLLIILVKGERFIK